MSTLVGKVTSNIGEVFSLFKLYGAVTYFTRYNDVDIILPVTPRDDGIVIRIRQLPGESYKIEFDHDALDLLATGKLRTEVAGIPLGKLLSTRYGSLRNVYEVMPQSVDVITTTKHHAMSRPLAATRGGQMIDDALLLEQVTPVEIGQFEELPPVSTKNVQ